MKIFIILNEPYPHGMANSKRIHLYARGLIELGKEVKLLIPKPKITEESVKISQKGSYDGVCYHYSLKSPYKSKSFLKRRYAELVGPLIAAKNCLVNRPDVIIVVSETLYYILLFKVVSILIGSTLLLEKSEVPFMRRDKINVFHKYYLKFTLSLFKGIITITDQLDEYFNNGIGLSNKSIILPILIDERNVNIEKRIRKKYLLYSGSFSERKDGVFTILKSMVRVVEHFPEIKLYFTGNSYSSSDYQKALEIINDASLDDHVVFKGFVEQRTLDKLMQEASLLILTKPINRQNKYNFPTKLGEYLISGTPVLCTLYDTYSKYFIPDENIYAVDFNADSLSKKIIEILKNPEKAEKVGSKGKLIAIERFSVHEQIKLLDTFIEQFQELNTVTDYVR